MLLAANSKIGISYYVQKNGSIFGSSRGQVAAVLADLFTALGHEVYLVHIAPGPAEWWEDASGISYRTISIEDCSGLDLLIDIDATISSNLRQKCATKTIGFLRGRVLMTEMEKSAYMQQHIIRNLEGICAIFVWDIFNPVEDIQLLETLFKLQVVRVPYIWTPKFLENYISLCGIQRKGLDDSAIIRIVEKNDSNVSSAIIPLTGIMLAEKEKGLVVDKVCVHNGLGLKETAFYKTNIEPNLQLKNQIEYCGRERFADWIEDDNSFVICHCRYIPFRPGMLDLIWLGIPFMHNSVILKDMGIGGYYSNNSVVELAAGLVASSFAGRSQGLAGCQLFSLEAGIEGWQQVLSQGLAFGKPEAESKMPEALAPGAGLPKPIIKVGFVNMWEGFNPNTNFFIDLLNNHTYRAEGQEGHEGANLVIFGPFGPAEAWQSAKCPKVFFSGENVELPDDKSVALYLSSQVEEDETHMRLPIWMLFLKWFGSAEASQITNPIGLPLELATHQHPVGYDAREKYCAFVVSNPMNEFRNDVFLALNSKMPVSSGGNLFNNIGGPLEAQYAGGGGGDVAKFKFLEEHKLNLCFENSYGKGYVTEKLLHAKLAGCVPIYWGDGGAAALDFDPEGFIDLSTMTNAGKAAKKIMGLSEEMCRKTAAVPALDASRLAAARQRLARIAGALARLAFGSPEPEPNASAQQTIPSPVFVSFATQAYLDSIQYNIASLAEIRKHLPKISYRVYLGKDVSSQIEIILQSKYQWVQFLRIPDTAPNPYPEFWDPQYFGWKLYILNHTCQDPELKDKLIVYTDSGAQWLQLADRFLYNGFTNGICMMLDEDNTNRQWCSPEMIDAMNLSEKELDEVQICAGFISYKGGHPLATKVFNEALTAALQNKNNLVGPKLAGFKDGKPIGHRHDQSILSIIRSRNNVETVPFYDYVCMRTLRLTALEQKPIYLHRGIYTRHERVMPGIDDIWIINLDRRPDRLRSWAEKYPYMGEKTNRLPAIDGKKLSLTPALATFFQGNDFIWKKAVGGVALSHILLWAQLALEKDPVHNYLVLEDDMRFKSDEWLSQWDNIVKQIPEDAELLYLGGILPTNKEIYSSCIQPVNSYWATIKPNPYFSGTGELVPIFHFCAYSYILTKSGARKLIAALNTVGCKTSIDHFLNHPALGLKRYVLQDLITTCFQENDPIYQKSEFDNFKRVDTFDSDIWNNVDCWNNIPEPMDKMPPIQQVLSDVMAQVPSSIITQTLLGIESRNSAKHQEANREEQKAKVLYYKDNPKNMPEIAWLKQVGFNPELKEFDAASAPEENAWYLVMRPDTLYWDIVFKQFNQKGIQFNVLHLADEVEKDCIDFYKYACCKKVVRNYVRADVEIASARSVRADTENTKTHIIPLGPATQLKATKLPDFKDRKLIWTFHGTDWFERKKLLKPIDQLFPNSLHLTPTWQHATSSPPEVYSNILSETKFVPILRGNNFETYRLYEALEHKCIPLYVRQEGDRLYWNWLKNNLGLMEIPTWEAAKKVIEYFLANSADGEKYCTGIQAKWSEWKQFIPSYLAS